MARRKELPYDPQNQPRRGARNLACAVPENHHAAIMEAAPHAHVPTSRAELLTLRETLADAVDALDPRKRWVFNACIVERLPLRTVAAQLGLSKSYVHRLRETALVELRQALEGNEQVIIYLEGQA